MGLSEAAAKAWIIREPNRPVAPTMRMRMVWRGRQRNPSRRKSPRRGRMVSRELHVMDSQGARYLSGSELESQSAVVYVLDSQTSSSRLISLSSLAYKKILHVATVFGEPGPCDTFTFVLCRSLHLPKYDARRDLQRCPPSFPRPHSCWHVSLIKPRHRDGRDPSSPRPPSTRYLAHRFRARHTRETYPYRSAITTC